MRYFKDGKLINYELIVNEDIPFTYEIKDCVVYLNVKENKDCKEVWDFLYNNFEKLYRKVYNIEYRRFDGKDVVHYLGKKYILKVKKSDKNEMAIDKYTIIIYCKSKEVTKHKEIYRKYLKRAVEGVIVKIYGDIEKDFNELKMPNLVVKGLDRKIWAYNDLNTNTIFLSYQLGRYDEKYIKTIIYHELCHSFIIEHNESFYKLLDLKLENGRILEKEFDKIVYIDKL